VPRAGARPVEARTTSRGLPGGHGHGGERGPHRVGQLDVGDAGDREVGRHVQSQVRGGLQHADGWQVVGHEDRSQIRHGGQQRVRGVAAGVDGVAPEAHFAGTMRNAVALQGVLEAQVAPDVVAAGLAAHHGAHALVAQLQQVLGGDHAGAVEVRRHAGQRRRLPGLLPHAQHHRHAAAAQRQQVVLLHEVGIHHQHAARQRAAHRIQVGALLREVVVGVAHEQEVAVLAHRLLHRQRELGVERVGDAGDDHRDGGGAAFEQAAHAAGLPVQPVEGGLRLRRHGALQFAINCAPLASTRSANPGSITASAGASTSARPRKWAPAGTMSTSRPRRRSAPYQRW
jgi:hypothetical protein